MGSGIPAGAGGMGILGPFPRQLVSCVLGLVGKRCPDGLVTSTLASMRAERTGATQLP